MTVAAKPAAPQSTHDLVNDRFLSKEQVAELLHVHVGTLLRWEHMRIGPPRMKVNRRVLYSRAAVADWEEAQQHRRGR
jgi:DNA-binding transcriptional regulator YiaG